LTAERAVAQVGGRDGVRAPVDGVRKRPPTDDVGSRSGGASLLLLLGATPRSAVAGRDGRGPRATRCRGDRRGRSRSRGRRRRARGRRTRIGVPAAARSESTSVEADDELRHSLHDVRQDRLAAVGRSGISVERDLPEQEAQRGSHRQRRARRSGDAAGQKPVSARARPRASRGGAVAKEHVVDASSPRDQRWPGGAADVRGGRPSLGTGPVRPCGGATSQRPGRGRRRVGSGPARQCRSAAGSAATARRRRRRWRVGMGGGAEDWAESASFIFGGRRAPGRVRRIAGTTLDRPQLSETAYGS